MNHLFWGLLGFAVAGIAFVALVIAVIVIFRRRSAGSGSPITGSPNLLGTITQNRFARSFGIAIFLTIVYIFLLWLGYHLTAGVLVKQLGTEKRWAFLLITVLGLPLIEVIWWLYKAAGVPGESKLIGRSFRTFAVFILIFLGWWYHDQPNRLFDPKNGKANFWVAEKEQKLYFFPPSSKLKVYFSPATGETLRLGTPQDAEKFRKKSWLPKTVRGAKSLLDGSGISSTETVIETIAPVGDFGKATSIPECSWFKIHPLGKVRTKRLWDGVEYDDSPIDWVPQGDIIKNANFKFISRESEPVKVQIFYRPK